MSERAKELEKEVDWAYEVITSVVEAMDRAAAQPQYYTVFMAEFLKKMPTVVDAMMILTAEEHRPIMGRFLKASSRLTGEWLKAMGR